MSELIAIRTDANGQIGYGHFVRCLALAEQLLQQDFIPVFLCRGLPLTLQQQLTQRGIKHYALDESLPDIEASWAAMANSLESLAAVVVDHYELGIDWERSWRDKGYWVMAIDDLASRQHDCDCLLDQNRSPESTDYAPWVDPHCRLLLGQDYVLLREEFAQLRAKTEPRTPPIQSIVVFLGGGAQAPLIETVLAGIAGSKLANNRVDLVVGDCNFAENHYTKLSKSIPQLRLYTAFDKLSGLMQEASLAIGTLGSTTWERCALGLPSVVVQVAENQQVIIDEVADAGLMVFLGWAYTVSAERWTEALNALSESPDAVASMSQRCFQRVDGLGAARVAQIVRCEVGEN